MYKQKNSQTKERLHWLVAKGNLHQCINFQMSQFANPEPLEGKGGQVALRKDFDKTTKSFALSLSPVFPQRDLWPFTRVTVHWGKGNNQTFWGLLDTGSELTLIPGDPKKHGGPPVKVGAYGGQVINGVLADV